MKNKVQKYKEKRYNNNILNLNKKVKSENKSIKIFFKRLKIEIIDDPILKSIKFYKEQDIYLNENDSIDKIIRMTINYIRHNLTNYDNMLINFSVKGFYSKDKFRVDVNKRIMEKYNYFKEDIKNDWRRILWKII